MVTFSWQINLAWEAQAVMKSPDPAEIRSIQHLWHSNPTPKTWIWVRAKPGQMLVVETETWQLFYRILYVDSCLHVSVMAAAILDRHGFRGGNPRIWLPVSCRYYRIQTFYTVTAQNKTHLTFVPTISKTSDWISLSVIRFMWPLRT